MQILLKALLIFLHVFAVGVVLLAKVEATECEANGDNPSNYWT